MQNFAKFFPRFLELNKSNFQQTFRKFSVGIATILLVADQPTGARSTVLAINNGNFLSNCSPSKEKKKKNSIGRRKKREEK